MFERFSYDSVWPWGLIGLKIVDDGDNCVDVDPFLGRYVVF